MPKIKTQLSYFINAQQDLNRNKKLIGFISHTDSIKPN